MSAFLWTKNKRIQELYDKYNNINPADIYHPGKLFWIENRAGERSPVSPEELAGKSADEIIRINLDFKPSPGSKETKDGFANAIKNDVINNPDKYINNLYKFEYPDSKIELVFIDAIISGLYEVWKNDCSKIQDSELMTYIRSVIENVDFNANKPEDSIFDYRFSILSTCVSMIKNICENDNYVITSNFLSFMKEILEILNTKLEEFIYEEDDYNKSFLVTPRGMIFEAMIQWSLRNARMNKQDDKDKWDDDVRNVFDFWLKKKDDSNFDFLDAVASCLPNMYYLDKQWVENNFDKIFDINSAKWGISFSGYVSYYNTVYEVLYNIFKQKGHYEKALQTEFENTFINQKVVQHIYVGYLDDWEDINDEKSLIRKILDAGKKDQIEYLIRFFCNGKIEDDETIDNKKREMYKKVKSKVRLLWKYIYEKYKDKPEIFVLTIDLLCLLDELDNENIEWIKAIAKNISRRHDISIIIKSYEKHIDKNPEFIAGIHILLLESKLNFRFYEDEIKNMVIKLYEKGLREEADEICNKHAENGEFFLRAIYNENNKG
ncbi:MAG: hypothetical protein KA120_03635 [Candidatus Goldbacteria bacterium]|nr:hypothetical protein [Candidatus Goldiibacteriota bacterium]